MTDKLPPLPDVVCDSGNQRLTFRFGYGMSISSAPRPGYEGITHMVFVPPDACRALLALLKEEMRE